MALKFGVILMLEVVLLAVCLEQSDAWFVRSIVGALCSVGCGLVCVKATILTVGAATAPCALGCGAACGRKKRSIEELLHIDPAFEVVPMPPAPALYDSNHDGYITVEEFAGFLGIGVDSGDLRQAFGRADKNGDGLMSVDEFHKAPFIFAEENTTDETETADAALVEWMSD